jgi:hypothetical protein
MRRSQPACWPTALQRSSWSFPIRFTGRRSTPISVLRAGGNCTRGRPRSSPAGRGWRITFIKLLGVGMIVALILDATLVRLLLVPAIMRLAGNANWWAPAPLRRFYARHGIHEDDGPAPRAVAEPAPAPART